MAAIVGGREVIEYNPLAVAEDLEIDTAFWRWAVKKKNKDPNTINPLSAVDLVIDHSVQVDKSANADSFDKNVEIEFERNGERYSFLKWGQQAFDNFRIVPPGTGICHQVNLE